MHLNENESRSSVTQSAIEQGSINITSTQTVAKNISEDNALTISRDTQNANQPLVKLDAKALEAQVAKDAQQRAADVGLVTRVTDDAYRVMFREPPRFYKATCQDGADCTKDPKKVMYEELKGTPQEIAADMLKNGGSSPVLATNGIFNSVDRAVELAFQNADLIRTDANGQPLAVPVKPTSIYVMHYIPANTMIGEGLVALYEQKFASTLGYTNSDMGYADAVTAYGQGSLTLLGHSRGTIVQNNAFNILQGQGFTNSQLSVRGVGGAVPVGQFTDAAAAVIGDTLKDKQVIFNYYGNDPVPTQ